MQNNIFKAIPYLIIIGLVVALSVTKCQHQELKQTVTAPFDSIPLFKSRLAAKDKQGEEQKIKWKSDSLKMSEHVYRLNKAVSVVTKQRDQARKLAQVFIDSIPEVKQFVHLDDSVDRLNLAIIDTLTQDKREIVKSFSAMLSTKEEQAAIMKEIINHLEVVNKSLSKDLKRERRRKTFYKVTTALGIVTVLYFAIQD